MNTATTKKPFYVRSLFSPRVDTRKRVPVLLSTFRIPRQRLLSPNEEMSWRNRYIQKLELREKKMLNRAQYHRHGAAKPQRKKERGHYVWRPIFPMFG